jgi:hypothetical protein
MSSIAEQSLQSIRRGSRHWAQHFADRPRFATSSEITAGNRSADNFELEAIEHRLDGRRSERTAARLVGRKQSEGRLSLGKPHW